MSGQGPERPERHSAPNSSQNKDLLEKVCRLGHESGLEIRVAFDSKLNRRDLLKAVTAFRRALIPPRRPGRRLKAQITAAHRDWKNGVRGVALYTAHIPGWAKHSEWRHKGEARALMDAIRSRERREKAKGQG